MPKAALDSRLLARAAHPTEDPAVRSRLPDPSGDQLELARRAARLCARIAASASTSMPRRASCLQGI
jgi:hypothetical protein